MKWLKETTKIKQQQQKIHISLVRNKFSVKNTMPNGFIKRSYYFLIVFRMTFNRTLHAAHRLYIVSLMAHQCMIELCS